MIATRPQLQVRQLDIPREANEWLAVPCAVYAGDPNFVPQLNLLEKQRIDPRKAPFFTFGEAAFFVAYRGTTPVGRITAQVNRRHLEFHNDNTGHFGFLDCANDPEAVRALLKSGEEWLKQRRLSRVMGPFNFSINEECGCLVAGFESPPAMLMPHGAPYVSSLVEDNGYSKVIDLFAYRTKPDRLPARIAQLAERAARFGEVRLRQHGRN
jgi:hypothetical protein